VEGNIPGRAPAWSDGRSDVAGCFIKALMELEKFNSYEDLWSAFSENVKTELQKILREYNECLLAYPSTDKRADIHCIP